jgi:hypothetical protein
MERTLELSEVIASMLEALRAERAAVREALGALEGQTCAPVRDGVRRVTEPGANVYRFECELNFLIADGTRVQVQAPGAHGVGEVVDHDPALGSLEVVLREDLGERVPDAALLFDSTHLLDLLAGRLESIQTSLGSEGSPVVRAAERALAFLTGSVAARPPAKVGCGDLSERQCAAVSFVVGQEAAYLWGPPGTGKTQTVAHLTHVLIERGERVLLTAHTNIATDTALLRVLDEKALPPRLAVRVGYCSEALRARGVGLDELVDALLRERHPDEALAMKELCDRVARETPRAPSVLKSARAALPRRFRAAFELLSSLTLLEGAEVASSPRTRGPLEERPSADRFGSSAVRLDARVRRLEEEIVEGASLVASTLTRLSTSRLLRSHTADSVVIDEASIASLVSSFVAACCARRRTIAVGDFMQLPAIVQAEHPTARRWLGRHVFASAGCDRADRDHPLRAMLDEQWRMHPQISHVVSAMFYAGRLTDAPAVQARAHPGPALLLLDTSALPAFSETGGSGSKRNPVHASLVASLVGRAKDRRVAVIAPYRAQVRRTRDEIRRIAPGRLKRGEVEVFTVHRFQGRDTDLVIFDLVEGPGTQSRFIHELSNADAPNLINAAMSRARERLIVVAHLRHLAQTLGKQALVNRVFAQMRAAGGLEIVAGDERDEAQLSRFLAGVAD